MRLSRRTVLVLIETLWNVNSTACREDTAAPERINRNIVECKFARYTLAVERQYRINRNIVECKLL